MKAVKWTGGLVLACVVIVCAADGAIINLFDDFSVERDYTGDLTETIWDGLFVSQDSQVIRLNSIDEPGTLAFQGRDTGNTNLVFLYIEVPADEDFEVITRLDGGDYQSLDGQVPWHSSGLMVKHPTEMEWVGNLYFDHPEWGATFIGRKFEDGGEENLNTNADGMNVADAPWTKMERAGDDFISYYSADGIDWVEYSRHTHPQLLGTNLHVGLVQQMHSADTATAYFGEFSLIPEPGTVGLLGLAGLVLFLRRRFARG